MIERIRSTSDRRSIELAFAASGRSIRRATLPHIGGTTHRQLQGFTSQKIETITHLLDRMVASLS